MTLIIDADLDQSVLVFELVIGQAYIRLQLSQKLVIFFFGSHIVCSDNDIDRVSILKNLVSHFSTLLLGACISLATKLFQVFAVPTMIRLDH
jgi:hypothetical protein